MTFETSLGAELKELDAFVRPRREEGQREQTGHKCSEDPERGDAKTRDETDRRVVAVLKRGEGAADQGAADGCKQANAESDPTGQANDQRIYVTL
jgi:hypothetical protein